MAGFTPIRTVVGGDDNDGFQPIRAVDLGPAPKRGLVGAALSSGTDQLMGIGYSAIGGISDAVGADSARDWANEQARRKNIDASLNGRPDLERIEDQSLGTALPYAAYQVIKQVPTIGAIMGAEMIPGVNAAVNAAGLARIGAVAPRIIGGGGLRTGADFAARRAALAQGGSLASEAAMGTALGYGSLYGESVEGGDPSPYKSMALAVPYGLAEAAVPAAVRGAVRAPANFSGGLGARMSKAGALGMAGEAGTEGIQNEMEMSMRGDLSPEEISSRRLNSVVAGGLVGGPLGSLGGIRTRPSTTKTVDDGQFDLINDTKPTPPSPTLGLGYSPLAGTPIVFPDGSVALNGEQELLARYGAQPADTGGYTGPTRSLGYSPLAGTQYVFPDGSVAMGSDAAFDRRYAPQVPPEPAYNLTTQMQPLQGRIDQNLGVNRDPRNKNYTTQFNSAFNEPSNMYAQDPQTGLERQLSTGEMYDLQVPGSVAQTQQQSGGKQAAAGPVFDAIDQGLMERGIKPNTMRRNLFTEVQNSGIEPESDLLVPFWTAMAQGQTAKAKNHLADAIIQSKKGAANVSTPGGTVTGPAPGVDAGGAVVQRGVVDRGSVPAGQPAGSGNAVGTGAAATKAVAVPNTQQQSSTVVNKQQLDDGYVDDEDAWNDFRPDNGPEYSQLTEGHKKTWSDLRQMGKLSGQFAEDMSKEYEGEDTSSDIKSTIKQIFGERDSAIIEDAFVNKKTAAEIGEKHGLSRGRVAQLVGTGAVGKKFRADKIKAAQEKHGWSDEEVASLMGQLGGTSEETQASGQTDTQIEDKENEASAEDMSLGEAGMSTIETSGGSTINYTDDVNDDNLKKLKPRDQAAALSQRAFEFREKADALIARVRDALAAGKEALTNNQSTTSLKDAISEYKELRRKVRETLAKAEATLNKAKGAPQEDAYQTEAERAQEAWDSAVQEYPDAPTWKELPKKVQENFVGYGEDNWTPDDVQAELVKLAKDDSFKEMRGDRTMVTDQDGADIVIKGVSSSDLVNRYDSVTFAFSEYSLRGIGNIPKSIAGWWTTNSDPNWDGVFAGSIEGQDGGHIILNETSMEDPDRAEWTVHHEIGHFLDGAHLEDSGIYSGMPQMNVRVVDDKIVPMGEVMREVVNHYNNVSDSPVSTRLVYPLDRSQNGDLNADRVREEVFAQLWAMYMTDGGREFLQSELPATAAFMESVYGDVRQTYGAPRNYGPSATNGAAAQGQAGGQAPNGSGQPGQVRAAANALRPSKTQQVTPKALKPQVDSLTKVLQNVGSSALNKIMFSSDLFQRAAKMGLSAAQEMGRLYQKRAALTGQIEREVVRIEQMYNRIPEAFKGTGDKSANMFVYDSTREGKWGFQPEWRKEKVTIDGDMAKRWNDMPEAQAWISAVLQHGDTMLGRKKEALLNSASSIYDGRIAEAQKAGDTDKVNALTKEKASELKRFTRLFQANADAPYAPLRRFGDWVVVGKSQAYLDAEEAGDNAKIAELQKSADDYHVTFAESYGSALALQRELEKDGFNVTEPRQKEAARNDMYGGMMAAFDKLRGNLDAELANTTDPKERAALKAAHEAVTDLYLQSLAENSARKGELRRRGVSGEIDMLRSFSTQGRADAHFLAAATFNPQMTQAIVKMRQQKQQRGNETQKSMAFNEIMARHEQSMKYDDGGWFAAANKATAVTSAWMLATSPMYYLQNLMQPAMLSVPYMSGQHDYTSVWGQLKRAYHEMGPLLTSAKVGEGFDFSKVPDDVRTAIQELVNRGRIDIGMDTELGKVKLEGDSLAAKGATRMSQFFRTVAQKAEAINRVSTAMTAYRLELKRTGDAKAALEYADEVLDKTHGDYTRVNAPRLFNTAGGKVALQFRKYQLIQLSLLTKLTHDAFKGASSGERAAAKKMLLWTLGHTAALAGVVGMPGFAAVSFMAKQIAGIFGDDDEPYDLENVLRKALGDGEFARVVMRGLPMQAGVDLSGKVGMGNALSILPYTDIDMTRAGFNEIATGLTLGATGGLGARVFQALGDIKDGDYYRGLTGLMPKGLADATAMVYEANNGLLRKNGDTLIGADEIGTFDSIAKAIGLPTAKESERKFDQQVVYETKTAFEDRAKQLTKEFVKARKDNDVASAQQVMSKWTKLQESRRNAGFTVQPLSTLLKAPAEQMKRDRNVAGGVQYDKNSKRMVLAQTAQ